MCGLFLDGLVIVDKSRSCSTFLSTFLASHFFSLSNSVSCIFLLVLFLFSQIFFTGRHIPLFSPSFSRPRARSATTSQAVVSVYCLAGRGAIGYCEDLLLSTETQPPNIKIILPFTSIPFHGKKYVTSSDELPCSVRATRAERP